ncbi:MAG: Pls/PosA family non-ribosomal peptide synthetase, partial [Lacisediminihabitans sp.]
VQRTPAGNQVLVGYVSLTDDTASFDRVAASDRLREELPAALVPLLAVVDALPTRTSGKVDRGALPWPLPAEEGAGESALSPTVAWLAGPWAAILGAPVSGPDDDFFAQGGGSLTAAQLVSAIRERYPETRVNDIYDHPRIGSLAEELESRMPAAARSDRVVRPVSRASQLAQTLIGVPLHVLVGLRYLVYLAIANNLLLAAGGPRVLPQTSWWLVAVGALLLLTPLGKMTITVLAARILLHGVTPGDYPRGGSVHLRLWTAEQVAQLVGGASLAGAPWITYYARALGAKIGEGVDLHTLPPVTGMLSIGPRAAIEPEVDLAGYWIDGDVLRLGRMHVGADAVVGSRSTLLAGASIGARAEVEPGSAVTGRIPAGERWAGSPAVRVGQARRPWPAERPPRASAWLAVYGLGSIVMAAIPVAALLLGVAVIGLIVGHPASFGSAVGSAFAALPLGVLVAGLAYALLLVLVVRLLGIGLREGYFPVRSRIGWQVWATERLLDSARTLLFPLYASLVTPVWLRALGATVGAGVEASTVLLIPRLTTIAPGAFLADDTMVATYELGGGWVRIGRAKVGKRAFLGNSGITGPGRSVPRNSLVAVLSSTPRKAKRGSSWLGNPPARLRRTVSDVDEARTFEPPLRLKLARGTWEVLRIVPVFITGWIALGVLAILDALWLSLGLGWTIALSGLVMLAAGAVAAGVTTLAKLVFVGRIDAREHPLWSSFVWRNEVSDTFVEMVARPFFAANAVGTPAVAVWLRTLGARVGRGVWCETYWLPEADLVSLGDGATVNRGCVVQTHLFHDRIMQLDAVRLENGATLGPHSVILPAASIDADATVGAASLVMRGERVPPGSLWAGNPISPWSAGPNGTASPWNT